MYKLFLTLRYLTRKKIVIFPILVVWLCVMMLVIVSSIMGGFVDRVRETNHDLLGDIIISSPSTAEGFANYDDLQNQLKVHFKSSIVQTTPDVEVYSLVHIPDYEDSRPCILVGIDPVTRDQVTQFRQSLFNQYTSPKQAVEDLAPYLPADRKKLVDTAGARAQEATAAFNALDAQYNTEKGLLQTTVPVYRPEYRWLIGVPVAAGIVWLLMFRARRRRSIWMFMAGCVTGLLCLLVIGLGLFWPILFPHQFKLLEDRDHQAQLTMVQADRTYQFARELPDASYTSKDQLAKAMIPAVPSFNVPAALTQPGPDSRPGFPPNGCIIGSQVFNLYPRDTRGNTVHFARPLYMKVIVTVFPANGQNGNIDVSANNSVSQGLTMVDDSHTGVFDVDESYIYADFNLVQKLAGLDADPADHLSARAQEILIRLTPEAREHTAEVRAAIGSFIADYENAHPDISDFPLLVQTWDERQAKYLSAVQNERVMVVFCIGLMSLVVLVVIFLIFNQIVRDKTRDIGIIKAVGGSEEGVAGIFITFGLFIGIVGGGLGVLGGWLFVTHTNQIHEAIFHATGIIIWDRSVYLFDRIPDVVHLQDVIIYFLVAVFAGAIGALFPALVAAFQDPVEAVRYE